MTVRWGRETELAEQERLTGSRAALAVVLALVVAGLFLVHALERKSELENCLMAGRISCGVAMR